MTFQLRPLPWLILSLLAAACGPAPQAKDVGAPQEPTQELAIVPPVFCHLPTEGDATDSAFLRLKQLFRERNPGFDIDWTVSDGYPERDVPHVLFIQSGDTKAQVGDEHSDVSVGDIVLLRPGEDLLLDDPCGLLVYRTNVAFPEELPTFIRPDWDEKITDTPGGCAEEEGAYRRILLTWLGKNGPYLYHALNAHRVRIMDSFSHYHPLEGGFDEFYLVQMVQPGAKLITSTATRAIEERSSIDVESAPGLMQERTLRVGDLVYLPRGTIHRGLGGVLAQVITIPGFRPGAEIGVDHHLRAINERLSLNETVALPYNVSASDRAVIK